MPKIKTHYVCQQCGAFAPKWLGQCADCQAWNSLVSEPVPQNISTSGAGIGFSGTAASSLVPLQQVSLLELSRFSTGQLELDRVLGGGLVPGSVVLLGGDPGIGKSTLLLQTIAGLSDAHSTLYVSGEESLQQITLRAQRLQLMQSPMLLLAETQVERIIYQAQELKPAIIVIDSIQTIHTELIAAAPGSVSQVRESTAQLLRFAKQTDTTLFIVGHVTKEGALAGPRILEHMVDTVLYFEGQQDTRFRAIRAIKNRFGAVNELGVFAMTDRGLKGVTNPSAIFLSRYEKPVSGSVVMVSWEGTRPLLVEIQALVADSPLGNPRRITVGLEQNRLAMLLAVLVRHGRLACYAQDVFVNAVGGVKVTETASDLALLLAIKSSFVNKPLESQCIVFGEVGLAGEIRPVQSGQERLKEAAKHGFRKAIVPKLNAPKQTIENLEVYSVTHITEALSYI